MKNKVEKMRRFLICVLFVVLTSLCHAQRPKVGLVLSGGGAKGISHIGILQAIDSAGLKIDYLTGTSMGSVIGSLYAIGYSGKQIETILNRLDWGVLLSNKPNYSYIGIEEKDEYGQYSLEVGIKDKKPQMATGLIESEELWLTFNELFLPVYNVKDFSKFNIPFKCVSTDLSTGRAVVHSKGEIVSAIRASMAIPSVFTAIDCDTTKLVDGGIIRNFPVSDIKEMGADIVIGVNLFLGLPDVSKLNTALDVFYQITQYRDAEDLLKEKKICDLIIEPPVDKYSAGSFGASDDIMAIGKKVGNAYYPYFKRLADSLEKLYPVKYKPQGRLPAIDTVTIDEITVEGIKNTSKDLLLDKIGIREGKRYTAADINIGFRKAYSSRYYDNVYYELQPSSPGHVKMKCLVKETLLTQAKFGLSFHTFSGPALFANVTIRDLLLKKSRTIVKVAAGEYLRVFAQHRQAFGRRANNYINAAFLSENLPLNVYEDGNKRFLYEVKYSQYDLNYTKTFSTDLSLTAGTSYQRTQFKPEITSGNRIKGHNTNLYSYLRTDYKTIDRKNFPTRGTDFYAEAGVVYAREAEITANEGDTNAVDLSGLVNHKPEFYRLKFNYMRYRSLHERMVLFYDLQGAMCINSQGFIFDNFFLGGVQPLFRQQMVFVGLNEGQITSRSNASAMLGLQYNFVSDFLLIGRANTALYDFSTLDQAIDPSTTKWINGFSLGLGYNLSFLPMEFTVMYSPEVGVFYKHIKIGFIF